MSTLQALADITELIRKDTQGCQLIGLMIFGFGLQIHYLGIRGTTNIWLGIWGNRTFRQKTREVSYDTETSRIILVLFLVFLQTG